MQLIFIHLMDPTQEPALRSGKDVRYALIGQGVYASHGYERTHKDGMKQTFELALNYVLK